MLIFCVLLFSFLFVTVDIAEAGKGNLQVYVNNGNVPCKVKPITSSRFVAMFVPKMSSAYIVDVMLNGEKVPNSPFRLNIAPVGKQEDSIHQLLNIETIDTFKVNTTSLFEIFVKSPQFRKEDLIVNIVDVTNAPIASRIVEESINLFRVYFCVPQVGNYQFSVLVRNTTLAYTFMAKAYDISKIMISDIPKNIILGQKCCIQGMLLDISFKMGCEVDFG